MPPPNVWLGHASYTNEVYYVQRFTRKALRLNVCVRIIQLMLKRFLMMFGNLTWATALIMGAIRIRNKIQLPDLLFNVGLVISTCLACKEVITCSYDQIRRAEFRGPSVIA